MNGGLAVILATLIGIATALGVLYSRRRGLWVGQIASGGLALAGGWVLWQAVGGGGPWLATGSTLFVVVVLIGDPVWKRTRQSAA